MAKFSAQQRQEVRDYWTRIQVLMELMPAAEVAALRQWEQGNLDGHSIGTADWPGFDKYANILQRPVWWGDRAIPMQEWRGRQPSPRGV